MSDSDSEGPSASTPRHGKEVETPSFTSEEESSYASSPSTPGANTPRPPSWINDSDVETSVLNVAAIEAEEGDTPPSVKGAKGLVKVPLKKEEDDKDDESSEEKASKSI